MHGDSQHFSLLFDTSLNDLDLYLHSKSQVHKDARFLVSFIKLSISMDKINGWSDESHTIFFLPNYFIMKIHNLEELAGCLSSNSFSQVE